MPCCSGGGAAKTGAAPGAAPRTRRGSRVRRLGATVEWAIPLTTLALVPKCPACVGGYILLFTGIGLSVSAAAAVRWTVIALCLSALSYLLLRSVRRVVGARA